MNKPLASSAFAAADQTDFRARFTTREFLQMGEAGAFNDMKVELVHGTLERMNPPLMPHSRMQGDLLFSLKQLIAGRSDLIATPEIGIDLGNDTLVGCDVVLATAMREPRMLRPDEVILAIEIASTTIRRDLGMKRQEYARAAVANYWVVDLDRRLVHRFTEPTAGEYRALESLRFGDEAPVPCVDRMIVIE